MMSLYTAVHPQISDPRGGKRMASPFYTAEHEAYREVVRRFVEKEIEPYAHEWDEAGGFPRGLYEKAAAIGLLGLGFPHPNCRTQIAQPQLISHCPASST